MHRFFEISFFYMLIQCICFLILRVNDSMYKDFDKSVTIKFNIYIFIINKWDNLELIKINSHIMCIKVFFGCSVSHYSVFNHHGVLMRRIFWLNLCNKDWKISYLEKSTFLKILSKEKDAYFFGKKYDNIVCILFIWDILYTYLT